MSVEIIVPWAGGCPHRQAALDYVQAQVGPVTLAEGGTPWCKGAAIAPAVAASTADVIVVHDADVICAGLDDAIGQVEDGAAWAMPHRGVFRLAEDSTRKVLAGMPPSEEQNLAQRPYGGTIGGGIVVLAREVALSVPMDPRFVGWGQEDEALGLALTTLAGEPWRGRMPLWHCWHPPQERMSRRRGNSDGWLLYQRYRRAHRDPVAMRSLLNEFAPALQVK